MGSSCDTTPKQHPANGCQLQSMLLALACVYVCVGDGGGGGERAYVSRACIHLQLTRSLASITGEGSRNLKPCQVDDKVNFEFAKCEQVSEAARRGKGEAAGKGESGPVPVGQGSAVIRASPVGSFRVNHRKADKVGTANLGNCDGKFTRSCEL